MGGGVQREVGVGGGCVCSLANYSVAYDETQSSRVSDFRDFACFFFFFFFFFFFVSICNPF